MSIALDALVENGWRCEVNMEIKPAKGASKEPPPLQIGGQDVQKPEK